MDDDLSSDFGASSSDLDELQNPDLLGEDLNVPVSFDGSPSFVPNTDALGSSPSASEPSDFSFSNDIPSDDNSWFQNLTGGIDDSTPPFQGQSFMASAAPKWSNLSPSQIEPPTAANLAWNAGGNPYFRGITGSLQPQYVAGPPVIPSTPTLDNSLPNGDASDYGFTNGPLPYPTKPSSQDILTGTNTMNDSGIHIPINSVQPNTSTNSIDNSSYASLDEPTMFLSGMAIDADGAPKAYNKENTGLDNLENAYDSDSGEPVGVYYAPGATAPSVQQADDLAPGYYVSPTALNNKGFKDNQQRKYVDASAIPYIVLPKNDPSGAHKGDFATVYNPKNGKISHAIFGDIGNHRGEGSIALAKRLGIDVNPRHGGSGNTKVFTIVGIAKLA